MKKTNVRFIQNNQKSKNIERDKSEGITLIALVITIIVLLILAGVTIATLTGDNGILTRANDAKTNTEQAEENELRKLTQAEAATYLENYEYKDPNGEKITIPAKCAVSQVEGENKLEDGLVIIDANGNEWVWIEVPESVTASSTTDGEIENALISYATEYRDSNYSDTWSEGCGLGEQEYANRYSEMLQSIKANNGFFIGRYEVGIKEDISRNYGTDYSTEHPINETPVIQQNKYPYTWVRCSQAEELSEKLTTYGNTCSLMFGIQWDLTMKYLEENATQLGNTKEERKTKIKTNSGDWGNYNDVNFTIVENNKYAIWNKITGELGEWKTVSVNYEKTNLGTDNVVLLSTGATKRNSVLNIYDLAGNTWEWILEKNKDDNYPLTNRGGGHRSSASSHPASSYNGNTSTDSSMGLGFRATLY